MPRKFAILEPLAIFGLIMGSIWILRAGRPILWAATLGLMVASHWLRGESAGMLGFGTQNFRRLVREFAPPGLLLGLLLVAGGILLGTIRPVGLEGALVALAAYLPWGLLQQYMLNGYFLNRFDALIPRRAAVMLTAALFCGAHAPNWFLMGVTLAGGYVSALVYRQHRNLYFLGLAHAIAGFLVFLVVPDSISHHLRVGPGWFEW